MFVTRRRSTPGHVEDDGPWPARIIWMLAGSFVLTLILDPKPPPGRRDRCLNQNTGMANHSCERWESEGDPDCIQRAFDLPREECLRWREHDAGEKR